jgi:hypothetical protein
VRPQTPYPPGPPPPPPPNPPCFSHINQSINQCYPYDPCCRSRWRAHTVGRQAWQWWCVCGGGGGRPHGIAAVGCAMPPILRHVCKTNSPPGTTTGGHRRHAGIWLKSSQRHNSRGLQHKQSNKTRRSRGKPSWTGPRACGSTGP